MEKPSEMITAEAGQQKYKLSLPVISLCMAAFPIVIVMMSSVLSALNLSTFIFSGLLYAMPIMIVAGLVTAIVSLTRGVRIIGTAGRVIAIISIVIVACEILFALAIIVLLFGFLSSFASGM